MDRLTFTVNSRGIACANFAELERKARSMTVGELLFCARDARTAAQAMPEGYKAGFYLDEIHVYLAEIKRRG